MIRLKEILIKKGGQPVTVPESSTVGNAIRTMAQHKVGSVMVLSSTGETVGIFTERDVLRVYAAGHPDLETVAVNQGMSADLHTAHPSDTINEALATMTLKRFRHLPVIEAGKMIGVVSIGDLVKAKLDQTALEAQLLREYINS